MLWLLRCIVAIAAIYWFSPLRTEDPIAAHGDWRGMADAARAHPDVAAALARGAAASTLSGLRGDLTGAPGGFAKP